jgi:hypothetical protein
VKVGDLVIYAGLAETELVGIILSFDEDGDLIVLHGKEKYIVYRDKAKVVDESR